MNKIYVKENGITRISDEAIKKEETKAVLINKMRIYDFTDEKGTILNNKSLKYLTNFLDYLNRKGFKKAYEVLTVLAYRAVTVTCEEDLTTGENSLYSVTNSYLKNYIKPSRSGFYNSPNKRAGMVYENELPVLLTTAKEVLKRFIKASLENYTEEDLEKIDTEIGKGANPLDYLKIDDYKFSEIEDETLKTFVVSQLKYYLSEKIEKDEGYKHLCGDCSCQIKDCPKIMDIPKRNISEYDFITDGSQKTHTEKNEDNDDPLYQGELIEVVDEFLVTKCKKFFKKEPKKQKTQTMSRYIVKK